MPVDLSKYENQRNAIENQYTNQAATNTYSRFLSQQRGQRQIADYTQGYKRSAPNLTAAYQRRGLAGGGVQSGVYQNAMRNYVGDYQQNLNRQYADMGTEERQYDLAAASMAADRERAMADLELQKTQEIAMAAQYLQALRPQYS